MADFTPEQVRDFLRENVTVIAPGETLVIRTTDLTPNAMREYQEALDAWYENGRLPFRCIVLHGDGLAVASDLLALVAEGKISVNDARKALGLPTWPVPECDEARETP